MHPTMGAVSCTTARRKSGETTGDAPPIAGERCTIAGDIVRSLSGLLPRVAKPGRRCFQNACGTGFTGSQQETGGPNMADAREVMNIRQASQYLGVSPDTLYKYVSEEKIPAFKLGNRWKFKKSLLDAWMENQSLNTDVARPRKLARTVRAVMS